MHRLLIAWLLLVSTPALAGAFNVYQADLPIKISTGVTLRGTGNCGGTSSPYCQTSITLVDGALPYTGAKCGTDTSHEVACPNGGSAIIEIAPTHPGYNFSWAQCGNVGGPTGVGCGAISLDADAAQGQTTIQVHSTTGFSVGTWVLIDEASGAGYVNDPINSTTGFGQIWAASDWLASSGSPATGRVLWPKASNGNWDFGSSFPYQANSEGCWYSYCDRVTAELHYVTAVGPGPCPGTNCTVTFDDPLTIAFRQSGSHNAQVYPTLYGNQSGTFRNNGVGYRTPFTDPSCGLAVNDLTGVGYASGGGTCNSAATPGPLRAAGPQAYNYWFAYVGNTLGTSGVTIPANGWSYQGDWTSPRIFMLGWNDGGGGEDPYLDGVTASYIFRHGNYDYVNAAVTWASSYNQTLPNSFYLASKPSFFAGASCTYPWPWVTPTGTAPLQSNSCSGSGLPAKARAVAGTPFITP